MASQRFINRVLAKEAFSTHSESVRVGYRCTWDSTHRIIGLESDRKNQLIVTGVKLVANEPKTSASREVNLTIGGKVFSLWWKHKKHPVSYGYFTEDGIVWTNDPLSISVRCQGSFIGAEDILFGRNPYKPLSNYSGNHAQIFTNYPYQEHDRFTSRGRLYPFILEPGLSDDGRGPRERLSCTSNFSPDNDTFQVFFLVTAIEGNRLNVLSSDPRRFLPEDFAVEMKLVSDSINHIDRHFFPEMLWQTLRERLLILMRKSLEPLTITCEEGEMEISLATDDRNKVVMVMLEKSSVPIDIFFEDGLIKVRGQDGKTRYDLPRKIQKEVYYQIAIRENTSRKKLKRISELVPPEKDEVLYSSTEIACCCQEREFPEYSVYDFL